jgi:uncharacterized membrane protein
MIERTVDPKGQPTSSSARRAWIAVALTPVGVVVAIGIAYAVAGLLGVTLDPATPQQTRTFPQNLLCYGVATLIVLIAPLAGIVLSLRPARAGSTSGRVALVVSSVLALGALSLMVPNLVTW